jgi:hypothetical protein
MWSCVMGLIGQTRLPLDKKDWRDSISWSIIVTGEGKKQQQQQQEDWKVWNVKIVWRDLTRLERMITTQIEFIYDHLSTVSPLALGLACSPLSYYCSPFFHSLLKLLGYKATQAKPNQWKKTKPKILINSSYTLLCSSHVLGLAQ